MIFFEKPVLKWYSETVIPGRKNYSIFRLFIKSANFPTLFKIYSSTLWIFHYFDTPLDECFRALLRISQLLTTSKTTLSKINYCSCSLSVLRRFYESLHSMHKRFCNTRGKSKDYFTLISVTLDFCSQSKYDLNIYFFLYQLASLTAIKVFRRLLQFLRTYKMVPKNWSYFFHTPYKPSNQWIKSIFWKLWRWRLSPFLTKIWSTKTG